MAAATNPTGPLRRWVATTWRPLLLFALALMSVALTSGAKSRIWWVLPLAGLFVATTWISVAAQRQRMEHDARVRSVRLVVSSSILAVVMVITLVLRQIDADLADRTVSAIAFTLLGFALFAFGGLVTELRESQWFEHVRGPVALITAVVALGLAVTVVPVGGGLYLVVALGLLAAFVGCEVLSEDWLRSRGWNVLAVYPLVALLGGAGATVALTYEGANAAGVAVAIATGVAVVLLVVWERRAGDRYLEPVIPLGPGERPPPPWRNLAVLGGALLIGAVVVLHHRDVALGTAIVLAVVLFGAVWFTASRSNNLLMVLVAAVALLWAAAPRTEGIAEAARGAHDGDYFVAFGDSYISGEGAAVYQDRTNTKVPNRDRTNECRRANSAWPILLADAHVPDVPEHVLVATCSGAVTDQLRLHPTLDKAAELLLYQREVDAFAKSGDAPAPAFALVSIGGNDSQFSTVGKTCIAPGDCSEFQEAFLAALDTLPVHLDAAYHDINELFGGQVPIIVVPYPDPIAAGEAECADVFLSGNERRFVAAYAEKLNTTIRDTAAKWGFEYMDTMYGALADEGSRLCDGTGAAGINFISWHPQGGSMVDALLPTNWTHNSLHPNEVGHQQMRAAAERWFELHPVASLKVPGPNTSAATRPPPAEAPEIVPDDWLPERVQELARSYAVPALMAVVGAWLVLIVQLRWAFRRQWSVAGKVREVGGWLVATPPRLATPPPVAAAPKAPAKRAPARKTTAKRKTAAKKTAAKKAAPRKRPSR